MDMSLSEEQEAVRKAVKAWVDDVVVPRALENDREERFPQEALDGLRDTGFIGLTVPEQYEGGGADPLSYVLFIEELGRGDANVRSIVSVHLALVAGSIARWGTEEQKSRWLPQMATGEVLGCFGLTEPDHGSNPADLQASAVRQPDGGYLLNGNKIFITNGTIAGLTLFLARPAVRGQGRQRLPGAERQPRLRGPPVHGKLGLRSCDTAELVLRDVRVGPEALLGGRRAPASGSR
jgi:alkylation response protein AidB-like acyl-CoA dehydrogenase